MAEAQDQAVSKDDMQEAFNLFDHAGSGKLKISTLDQLVRACGLTPSDAQISQFKKEIDTSETGEYDFNQLYALILEHKTDAVKTPDDVLKAFQVFDRENTGTISTSDLKSHMANLGERLNDNEVVQLIKDADPQETGKVVYADFVKLMTQGLVF